LKAYRYYERFWEDFASQQGKFAAQGGKLQPEVCLRGKFTMAGKFAPPGRENYRTWQLKSLLLAGVRYQHV